jgi:glycogen operon protein
VRDFWRGEDQTLGELAYRFAGSPDLYENTSRLPFASINFITAHDGFTLHDLVSYNHKHNEDNGEENQDGEDFNRSWNCGAEGPTDDSEVMDLRTRQKRNFLTTLFLSQGVPMLLGGDETGRTQNGNNNCYCQDNELSWFDWEHVDQDLLEFCQGLIGFRLRHPAFRRRRWFQGRSIHGAQTHDIAWFTLEGKQMDEENWGEGFAKSLAIYLNGRNIPNPNPRGDAVSDDNFYIILNAHYEPLNFTLPSARWGESWIKVLDTTHGWLEEEKRIQAEENFDVQDRSMILLRQGE